MKATNSIIKPFDKFPEKEIKSIILKPGDDERVQYLYLDDKNIIIKGIIPISVVKKVGPNVFKFKVSSENIKKYRHFQSFFNKHIIDALAGKLYKRSDLLYGRHISKKAIVSMFTPIVDKDGFMYLYMYNKKTYTKRGGETTEKLATGIFEDTRTTEGEKEIIKVEKVSGVTVSNFVRKYKKGATFVPSYLLDRLVLRRDSINFIVTPYQLKIVPSKKKKRRVYTYSDDEDSDQEEYLSDVEVEKKKEEVKEEVKEEAKEEPESDLSDYDSDDYKD